jgi:hypothetical protein
MAILERILNRIYALLEGIGKSNTYVEWERTPGQSLVFTYYTGATVSNPSGDANVHTISYYEGTNLKMVQTYSYNASNAILSIIAS